MTAWRLPNDAKFLSKACQKLALQHLEVEKDASHIGPDSSKKWHTMPKLHLPHLCEMGCPPRDTWPYVDETMEGTLAKYCSQNEVARRILDTVALKPRTGGATPLLSQQQPGL